MYVPFISDYYNWCIVGKYWFSDKGKGVGSVVGLILAMISGVIVAPIKTVLDLLCYGYQKIVTLLMHVGAFFAEHEAVGMKPYHHKIKGVDLRQENFFFLFLIGFATFFSFLPYFIIKDKETRINFGAFLTGVLILPILPIIFVIHFILNNLSYTWIAISDAFDKHASFCLADQERCQLITSEKTRETARIIDDMTSTVGEEVEEIEVKQNSDITQMTYSEATLFINRALQQPGDFLLKQLVFEAKVPTVVLSRLKNTPYPSALAEIISDYCYDRMFAQFDTSSLSGRKKIIESYNYLVQYVFINTFSINSDTDFNNFSAYLHFFRYLREFDDVVVRVQSKALIKKCDKESKKEPDEEFFGDSHRVLRPDEHGNLEQYMAPLKDRYREFSRDFPKRTKKSDDKISFMKEGFIKHFKETRNPHPPTKEERETRSVSQAISKRF